MVVTVDRAGALFFFACGTSGQWAAGSGIGQLVGGWDFDIEFCNSRLQLFEQAVHGNLRDAAGDHASRSSWGAHQAGILCGLNPWAWLKRLMTRGRIGFWHMEDSYPPGRSCPWIRCQSLWVTVGKTLQTLARLELAGVAQKKGTGCNSQEDLPTAASGSSQAPTAAVDKQ